MQQSCNEEIAFAGVQVHPGDLVIADGSGVVFVPCVREAEVIAQAEALAEREARMAAAIRAGRSIVEVMESMGYESMLTPNRSEVS
jgi:4-hydroxy-4-methyl-2-oxoglutarate aldolase